MRVAPIRQVFIQGGGGGTFLMTQMDLSYPFKRSTEKNSDRVNKCANVFSQVMFIFESGEIMYLFFLLKTYVV